MVAIASLAERPAIASPAVPGLGLGGARILAPILSPPHNIMCVGKNYFAHAHEFTRSGFDADAKTEEAVPDHPIIFTSRRAPFPDRATSSHSGPVSPRPSTMKRSWPS